MARPGHKAEHTHRQVHEMFRALLGPTKADARNERVFAIPIDGIPLGDRAVELRHPMSNFYGDAERETMAIARGLVDLGLDTEVKNVVRVDLPGSGSSLPDTRVDFKSGASVYVECTTVDREETRFARYCEEAQIRFRQIVERDAALRSALRSKSVIVNVSRRVPRRPTLGSLADDVAGFIKSTSAVEMLCETPPEGYAALHAAGATVSVRAVGGTTEFYALFKPAGDWVPMDGIETGILGAIRNKQRKAAKYPRTYRPLWLVISFTDERVPSFVLRPTLERTLATVPSMDSFDAVIIEVTGEQPVTAGNVHPPESDAACMANLS